jgi:radical SAM superfamily enzyme
MSGIYCPLTNGTANYETCANCVEMLCEDQKISDKKIKMQKKKKKNKDDRYDDNENG